PLPHQSFRDRKIPIPPRSKWDKPGGGSELALTGIDRWDGGVGNLLTRRDRKLSLRCPPGICPGRGWQILSRSGRRGPVGERGARGEVTPTIIHWAIDPIHYRAVPMMSDGMPGEPRNLRPLFERYQLETS